MRFNFLNLKLTTIKTKHLEKDLFPFMFSSFH